MSDVRKRNVPNGADSDKPTKGSTTAPKSDARFKVTDILRILGGLLVLSAAASYFVTGNSVSWGYRPWWSKPRHLQRYLSGPVRLNDLELLQYNGADASKPVYIALNGTIYDVSAGRHVYGPGGSYSFFAGRDATRAFITGCFDTDLTPDIRGAWEAYMPVDAEEVESYDENGRYRKTGGKKDLTPAQEKVRRELETRKAKKKVQDTIEGWAFMFSGKAGKDYFEVGQVVRPEGWLEKLPVRELCQRAQNTRPKRRD
ncbi:hypothetical protein MBLNU457_1830t2 [Dothideomycetes sp. NU457]